MSTKKEQIQGPAVFQQSQWLSKKQWFYVGIGSAVMIILCVLLAQWMSQDDALSPGQSKARVKTVSFRNADKTEDQSAEVKDEIAAYQADMRELSTRKGNSFLQHMHYEGADLGSIEEKIAAPIPSQLPTAKHYSAYQQRKVATSESSSALLAQLEDMKKQIQSQSIAAIAQLSQQMNQTATQAITVVPPSSVTQAASERQLSAVSDTKVLVEAGSVEYGYLANVVNSDYDAPVVVNMITGELKGGRLIGGFKVEKYHNKARLEFNQLFINGQTLPIKAIAVDAETYLPAVADDVDHHILYRYGSLALASLLKGYGEAIQTQYQSDSSDSVYLVQDGGEVNDTDDNEMNFADESLIALGEMGDAFQGEVKKNFNRPITVSVNSGRGLGILFVESVIENASQSITNASEPGPNSLLQQHQHAMQQVQSQLKTTLEQYKKVTP